MRLIEDKHIKKLHALYDFVEAFVDYHDGDPEVYDGQPTDYAILKDCLPALKEVLNAKKFIEKKDAEPQQSTISEDDLKNAIYNAEKRAAEAVNPNYKYCVVDADIKKCGLTDDFASALQEAKTRSTIETGHHIYVLEIRETYEGFMTFFECNYDRGEYYDSSDRGKFLHYDYIAKRVDKVYKF